MKSYDGVKKDLQQFIASAINDLKKKEFPKFGLTATDERDKRINDELIERFEYYLNNIDEVTTIYIGSMANETVDYLKQLRGRSMQKYFNEFEKTVFFSIEGIGNNPLGITMDDLKMFIGEDPTDDIAQVFINRVNMNFNTNVVLPKEFEQAKNEYFSAKFRNEDENDINRKLVRYMELARDSGKLREGTLFYTLLEENKEYQEAKEAIAGMAK